MMREDWCKGRTVRRLKIEPYVRTVNYYETDQMHVVHHSNHIRYMEEARLYLMEQMGLNYEKMEELGIIIPVLEVSVDYKDAIHYGDTVYIECNLTGLLPARFGVAYRVTDENKSVKALGRTSHAFLDADFKPMNMKKKFPEMYQVFQEATVMELEKSK